MQLDAISPAAVRFYENAAIIEHGGDLMAFIRDDDCPESYVYLENKLKKHVTAGNPEKVVTYLLLMQNKSFDKAPESAKVVTKVAKDYLRKRLGL